MAIQFYHFMIPVALLNTTILNPAAAEIVPTELGNGNNSELIPNQVVNGSAATVITGGVARDQNLFHIFDDFDVLQDERVFFLNANGSSNIFSLTTGSNASFIGGTLGVIGSGDLFFINPNGISFGPNAALSIQGSFLGSTANSLNFSDGTTIFLDQNNISPILSVSAPVGLGFSSVPSSIVVEDSGHTLAGTGTLPYMEQNPEQGLSVLSGNTLALIGGDILLNGGILRAPNGSAEIAAIKEGYLSFNQDAEGPFRWLTEESSPLSGSIIASNAALIDSSGAQGGSIYLRGQNILLRERAVALTTGTTQESNGSILISSQSLILDGDTVFPFVFPENRAEPSQTLTASIISQSLGTSPGIDINIKTEELTLENGGGITVRGFELGKPGNINITANSVRINDSSPQFELLFSSINTLSFGPVERSGNIRIEANSINLENGGLIASSSFGNGKAGDIYIDASQVRVDGVTPRLQISTSIQSSSYNLLELDTDLNGDAGNLFIDTDQLSITNGGFVGSTAVGSGNTGGVFIDAQESITISSPSTIPLVNSGIRSTIRENDRLNSIFTFSGPSSGNTGIVYIKAPSLIIREGGSVSVQNEGIGDSGQLFIDVSDIQLRSSGSISALTTSGQGGDVRIDSQALLLIDNSSINASSGGTGNGGNVDIKSDVITLVDNSSISANAAQGAGGQVFINAEALIQSSDSPITATSDSSAEPDGTVDITESEASLYMSDTAIERPTDNTSLALSCINTGAGSGFVVTGRGGTPLSHMSTARYWGGWTPETNVSGSLQPNRNQIIEAQGWIRDDNENVHLVTTDVSPSSSGRTSTGCVAAVSQ